MKQRLLAVLLCLVLLVSCGGKSTSSSESRNTPSSTVETLPMDFTIREQSDVEFVYDTFEDSIFTMLFEPVEDAKAQVALGLCIPPGYDSDPTAFTDTTVDYAIYNAKTEVVVATVTVQTAPPDPASYFGADTAEEIEHAMMSSYFTTERFYSGLRKNITKDFGYELVIDWTGTSFGRPAYYLEYIDTDKQTQSMRFYLCDDEMNEKFYSFRVAADVPIGDEAMLNRMRAVLFSLQVFDSGGVLFEESSVS